MRIRLLVLFLALTALMCGLFSAVTVTAGKQTIGLDGHAYTLDLSTSVPNQLNYQGYLLDSSDSSAVTATLEMTFRLFDSEAKGAQLWSETHPAVQIGGGLFQVLLGSITPFPDGLFDGSELWLQTMVGAEILSPRKPLVGVAYSHRAEEADHAVQADNTDQLESQTLMDLDDRWVNEDQPGCVTSSMITDGEIVDADVSITANIHPGKISGNAWTGDNDGDGSGLDADMLDSLDSEDFLSTANDYGRSGAATDLYEGTETLSIKYVAKADLDHLDAADGDPGGAIYVDDAGNVGIGTISPMKLLDVAGDMKATTYYGDGSNLTGISGTTDNDWTINGDDVYHQTGKVGIGTSSIDEKLHIENSASAGSAFLKIETSHATNWHEAGIRIETPQNRWHLRMDDDANNNIPDGALGLRSQDPGAEVMVWQDNGHVGIGTTSPAAKLEVRYTASTGNAGYFHIDNATNDSSALYATTSGGGSAVYGSSISGQGWLGGDGYGAYGKHGSSDNYGHLGSLHYGVYGKHDGTDNWGYLAGSSYGVYGKHYSSGDYGYLGGNGYGVYGHSSDSYGVYGHSSTGDGVYGYSGSYGHGVYGYHSDTGNRGYLGGNDYGVYGIYGDSLNFGRLGGATYGVSGFSMSSYGVSAFSSSNAGLHASSNSGVAVFGVSTSGFGVYGESSSSYAGYFSGDVHINGDLTGGKMVIDHPIDPENKLLRHNFVESPQNMLIYAGKVILDGSGEAVVEMPEYFEALTKEEEALIHLTPLGRPFPVGYEWKSSNNSFIVYGQPDREVSWMVLANRDDPVMRQLARPVEEDKGPENKLCDRGELLYPTAYGYPESMGRDYKEQEEMKRNEPLEVE